MKRYTRTGCSDVSCSCGGSMIEESDGEYYKAEDVAPKPVSELPELFERDYAPGIFESRRMLVYDKNNKEWLFGCVVKSKYLTLWKVDGILRDFNITHWKYLPEMP